MSKFSPAEFWQNVDFTKQGVSPIENQKNLIGFSMPWQHHKGNNPHHYEYWMDRFDEGCYVYRMPYKYILEALCDYLGANKAYKGKTSTYKTELEWWEKQRKVRNMHPDNIKFLDMMIVSLRDIESTGYLHSKILRDRISKPMLYNKDIGYKKVLSKEYAKMIYNIVMQESTDPVAILIKRPTTHQ